MNLGKEYKLDYVAVHKTDISELIWKLENQFNDSPESSHMVKCIKCECVKSENLFVKEQYGNNKYKTTTNICIDCRDIDNANRYLINKLIEFEEETEIKSAFRTDEIWKEEECYYTDIDGEVECRPILQTHIRNTYNLPTEFVKLKAIMLKIKRKIETFKNKQI